ncbi:hypothetical protein F5887DRAFT_914221 [Amanita rubescens]|nr:hypothetical protein F5887DRAFT_914221 [Amanita rubescens]
MEDKKGDHEKEDDGEDDNIVKYGGFVGEGETDEVVERVAKKKVKKVKDENVELLSPSQMIKFTDRQIQDDGRQPGEKNWTTKHLPSVAAKAFEDQVVPMMRMKAGLLPPWETPTMRDLQATMDKVYGEGNFVEAAEGSIKKVISNHSKNLDTTAKIAELMTYYLSNTSDEEDEESRVFHWKDLDSETGTKSGFLASDVITRTLGVAYLSKFPEFLTDLDESKPVGTLVLATQAVRMLNTCFEQWTTGCIVKSTKEISADSYKKYEGLLELPEEPGKPKTYARKIIHRTNFFTENIEVFKEHHLKTILDEALRLMPEKWQKKRGVAISKAASQDEISIVDTQSNTRHRRIVVVD